MSRWLPWVTRDGEVIQFKMPSKVHEELTQRLARLVRDRDRVGRFVVSPAEALAANQVAIALVLCHGGDMRPFYFDRRAMSRDDAHVGKNLNLNEWMLRRAREILEAVGFTRRAETASLTKWQRYDLEDGYHPERARRKPTLFEFGHDFVGWLSFAVRKIRFRFRKPAQPARDSLIQEGFIGSTDSTPATPSADSWGHLGESEAEQVITVALEPRWRQEPEHRPRQIPLPRLRAP
jgi:hypothetical protein